MRAAVAAGFARSRLSTALRSSCTAGAVGPYRQSERLDIYKKVAQQLLDSGDAYPCFCSEAELEEKRQQAEAEGRPPQYDRTWRDADPAEVKRRVEAGEPYTVRFKVSPGKRVEIDDMVRGSVAWDADATVGDFILLRSTGMPVYNFCVAGKGGWEGWCMGDGYVGIGVMSAAHNANSPNAVDDALMGITHVIRAEEHLTNTLRQCLILEALKYPQVGLSCRPFLPSLAGSFFSSHTWGGPNREHGGLPPVHPVEP